MNKKLTGGTQRKTTRFARPGLAGLVKGFVLLLIQSRTTNAQEMTMVDGNQRDSYKDVCTGYISTVKASYTTGGGLPGLTRSAYQLAVDNPTGPYISCTQIYPGISGSDIRVLVNPFLPSNKTLAELSQGSSESLTKALETSAEKAIDSCCGELLSFGLPFNQTESQNGTIVVAEAERDFIGFAEELNDSTYIFCGCPITDVSDGERNNTLALEYLSQNVSEEEVTSGFTHSSAFLYTAFFFISISI